MPWAPSGSLYQTNPGPGHPNMEESKRASINEGGVGPMIATRTAV